MPSNEFTADALIVGRLHNIYKAIGDRNRGLALSLVRETLIMFQNANKLGMENRFVSNAIGVCYKTLVELAMYRYELAHDQIRNLYYNIESKYIGNYSGVIVHTME